MEKDKDTNKAFDDRLALNDSVEKEEQQTADAEVLEEIVEGRQVVYINGYGEIIFDFPSPGIALQADSAAIKFKTQKLRSNEFLTEAQLKAIYRRPTVISIDGKDQEVGSGEWTDENEVRIDALPGEIEYADKDFLEAREKYHLVKDELDKTSEEKRKEELEKKLEAFEQTALEFFNAGAKLKSEQLDLNITRTRLFSGSLEEQVFFERVKYLAPSCIKIKVEEQVAPLWKNFEAFEADKFAATKVLALFSLFLRGLDVSFFGDVPEGTTPS